MPELSPVFLGFMLNLIILIVAVVRSHESQTGRIELQKKDIENVKEKHEALERRFLEHERAVFKKLDDIKDDIHVVKEMVAKLST